MNRFAFLLLAACAAKTEAPPPAPAAEPPPPPPIPEYAKTLVGAMDTKANACEDFYRYACGGWMDATPLPADKPLTLVSYVAAPSYTAYVEAVAVGDPLPAMPVFLDQDTYVLAPLDETYGRTWEKCPREMREFVINPPA